MKRYSLLLWTLFPKLVVAAPQLDPYLNQIDATQQQPKPSNKKSKNDNLPLLPMCVQI